MNAIWDRDNLMAASNRVIDSLRDVLENLGAGQWLRSGVTTTYVSPGSENLVGGLGAIVKLTGEVVRETAAVSASFGETALDAFEAPTTRQGMIAILRQTFIRAEEDSLEGDDSRIFAQLLTEELPFRVLVNTPDDILTALRLAEEFELNLVLDSAAGGREVAAATAAADVPVVVGPTIIGGVGPYEMFAHTPANAAALHRAGVRIALATGGFGTGRSVAMEAVIAKAHGLPEEAALAAVTSDAASILGIGDRVGALAVGMDADIVLWKGRPISTWAETKRVIVGGKTVFER
jgi:imidazolonepropionase-like amidohydrolase